MINGRLRSIILQVAFKQAAIDETISGEVDTIKLRTVEFYTMLLDLHDELNIDPEDGAFKSTRLGGGGPTTSTSPPVQGETFIFDSVLVEDFRAAKAVVGSTVKPNYPDFKTVNGQPIEGVTNPRGAAWLHTQDGAANEAVGELVEAADGKIF